MWFRSHKQDLRDEIAFLRAQIAQLQNYLLMTGGVPTGFPTWEKPTAGEEGPELGFSMKDFENDAQRLYTTEAEEDIEFQLQEGLIGEAEARRLLKQAAEAAEDIELM